MIRRDSISAVAVSFFGRKQERQKEGKEDPCEKEEDALSVCGGHTERVKEADMEEGRR